MRLSKFYLSILITHTKIFERKKITVKTQENVTMGGFKEKKKVELYF